MAVIKTKRLVRWFEWNIKTVIYVAVHDRPVGDAVIVGPLRHFIRRVLVTTDRDLSDAEAERLVGEVLKSDLRCNKCHYRGGYDIYVKVDVKDGKPDFSTTICSHCNPHVGCVLTPYEVLDILLVETRGN